MCIREVNVELLGQESGEQDLLWRDVRKYKYNIQIQEQREIKQVDWKQDRL